MKLRELTEKKAEMIGEPGGDGYQCCFCGLGIDPRPPDICMLTLRTVHQDAQEEPSQELFCHAKCLQERLLAGIPTILDAS